MLKKGCKLPIKTEQYLLLRVHL